MIIPLLRIALISKHENTCGFYKDMLSRRENIILETYTGTDELKRGCREKLYAGLIVDMWTHIASANADKEFVYSLDKVFPILYIGDNDQKPSELHPGGGWLMARQHEIKILEDFIQNQCRDMKSRGIRTGMRKNLFFNTHAQLGGQEKSFKTNTKNISQNGCFVISVHELPCGTPVWLTITDLDDKTPIAAEIRWSKPWGNDFLSLPGVGVVFREISLAQRQALTEFLK
ncbi:MAG: PilZ domain-containing protein [Candidatus Aminicenantes bacterium]|nr:PilZ domain-containing protein [Candidatus Aminicenantes bacterium]